ncbi:hypothetical protein IQ07DRAFT_591740 [Pyrenochaeta sp. DS3sAY3a]|nr:hypothetical protein IQ07DRAFT_591740 [Pyrenochaeta sp. DS3sAY3a]
MPSFTSTFLYVSAALLGATSAFPMPGAMPGGSCKISYPTSMTEFTPHGKSDSLTDFCISSGNRVKFVEFGAIPSDARGACQLEFYFPAGYSIYGPGNHQVNVWKTERAPNANDTWTSAPKPITTFGTVTLNSKPTEESRIIVNSGSCESMKHFKVGMVDYGLNPGVNYIQEQGVAGMRIVHSC